MKVFMRSDYFIVPSKISKYSVLDEYAIPLQR
jgi:hypothetical protein